MRPIRTHTVIPYLPAKLADLRPLAYNLRWTWDHDTLELFRRLNPEIWEEIDHNPVRMLATLQPQQLERAAEDKAFLSHLERVRQNFNAYTAGEGTWFQRVYPDANGVIAYFSAEYGLTEVLPMYSGGLGVLAGDHLKSASGLGVPLVAVGLLYSQAYFRQRLHRDGSQEELYLDNDFRYLPITLERDDQGHPRLVQLNFAGRPVSVQIWRVEVGRVRLYLLDTNIAANYPEDRVVTERLYRGDLDIRIRQWILLGIGGLRALRALGIEPAVCHMNEGHSAFLVLERIRLLMREGGLSFPEAKEVTYASSIFTTHTPVPAGFDRFPAYLIDKYLSDYYSELGLTRDQFLSLGHEPDATWDSFCTATLALRFAAYRNAVSKLHGEVTRRMWQKLWPEVPKDEIPITHVTNGVHPLTWTRGHEIAELYDRYLDPRWKEDPDDPAVWEGVMRIPDEVLWNAHERHREEMVAFVRRCLMKRLARPGIPADELDWASSVLDPSALTIGFSRRFATYKRADLIFRKPERLARILRSKERPVQLVISGKAHPDDMPAKELIRRIFQVVEQYELRNHVVFVEDYDMHIARHLVQGVDLWLTTPRRPYEASGTSGMKVAFNGGLNLSVLDGWWCEAYDPSIGWAIGYGDDYPDPDYRDEIEANALYDILENEIVPLFYKRGRNGLPREWIARMKASMRAICPVFNTDRVVGEYVDRFYVPAMKRRAHLLADGGENVRSLVRWMQQVEQEWPAVQILSVTTPSAEELVVGSELEVRAEVALGNIQPDDVMVELCHGLVGGDAYKFSATTCTEMSCIERHDDGVCLFIARIIVKSSGTYGYTVRVLPRHKDLVNPHDLRLIRWAV